MIGSSSIAAFFRTLPDTLQQPTALAMIGSVGAHLLVFATLPAFTSSTDNPDNEVRRVQIVDLPQRQEAPPNAASGLRLPPVPNPSASPQVQPSLPPIALNPNTPPNPLYTIPSDIPVPPPPAQNNDWLNRLLAQNPPRKPVTTKPKPLDVPAKPPSPDSIKPSPNAAQPTRPATPSNDLKQADPGEIAKAVESLQNPGVPPANVLTEEQKAAIAYNPVQTDPREVQTRWLGQWASSLSAKGITDFEFKSLRQVDQPIPELQSPLTAQIPTLDKNPASPAVIVQLVGKDGKLIGEPELIGSTGYKLLNDAAIATVKEAVKKQTFPSTQKARAYIYEYQFKAPPASTATTTPPPSPPNAPNTPNTPNAPSTPK